MNIKARLAKLEQERPVEPARVVVQTGVEFDADAYRAARGIGAHVPLIVIDTGIRRAP